MMAENSTGEVVKLISAEDAEIKRILDKQIWDVQGYNLIGKAVFERILRKLWNNACVYGTQEQQGVDADIIEKLIQKEIDTRKKCIEKPKSGKATTAVIETCNLRLIVLREAAEAIRGEDADKEEK